MNKAKFVLVIASIFFLFVLVGCAGSKKSDLLFVPLQISWEPSEGVDTEDTAVSSCMVRLTNKIMEHPEVQKNSGKSEFSYVATISTDGNSSSKNYTFVGGCAPEAVVLDQALCQWKASCDINGNVSFEFSSQR